MSQGVLVRGSFVEQWYAFRNRTMIIWDPDKCAINDEIRISDYLGYNYNKQ